MSKKTCFMIFVVALVAIIAAFMFKFTAVTQPVNAIFGAMKNPYIAGSAVILSLLLRKQKYYWLLMLGCAVVAAVLVQLFVTGGALTAAAIVYKAAAFIAYAYLVTLIRFML